jgi:hypothetical protein
MQLSGLLRAAFLALVPIVIAGCASSGQPVDTKDETVSLVYGYFDMKNAPSDLEWVSIRQYDGKSKERGWYRLAAKDGLFFHVGIEPGSYQVEKFGGTGGIPLLTRRPFEYNYGSKGRNATAVRIQKPGLYFLGTHEFVNHAGKGLFEPDRFDMKPAKTPGEKELLQRLIKELETDKELAGYGRQLRQAKQRLSEL